MSQRISSPVSSAPSRLARIRSTACVRPAGWTRPAGQSSPPRAAARSAWVNGDGSRRPSSMGPASVSTSRPGPPASSRSCRQRPQGRRRCAVPGDHAHRGQRAAAGRVQRGDQPAFGAEREPVGGVLDVASHHDPAVAGLARRPDPQPRVGRVCPLRHLGRRRPQPGPVDRHRNASGGNDNSALARRQRAEYLRRRRGHPGFPIAIWQRRARSPPVTFPLMAGPV